MRKTLTSLCLLALIWLPGNARGLPAENTIEFANCMLALPGTTATAKAECGALMVPEQPDKPHGRQISIHVALARATSTRTQPDPVFFFAGGPGQAASETWVMLEPVLKAVRKSRDIVMIDQRGTGRSNKLHCVPESAGDLNAEIDLEQLARETEKCLPRLDADPRFYTTTIAMQDYDRVRRAMGYERINLIGVSYGTRAAQVYLRQFPDTVRSVILDSVVPMQLALGQEHAEMLDRAVAAVFEDCQADHACRELFPNGQQGLGDLVAELRRAPRWITITNPVTGKDQPLRLGAETLAVAIRFLSYQSETQAVLPLLIHEAATTGRVERLASQAILVMSGLSEMLARGMELSVMCSEDYPFMDLEQDQAETLLGDIFLAAVAAQCRVWPRGQIPDGFHDPVHSDTPVLLLAGERDPVTPPHYAHQAAAGFTRSRVLIARGQSHSVLRNVCLRDIATRFIEHGSLDELGTECVERIRPAPFFTSLLGPEP